MISTNLLLISLVASINAIPVPVPKPQTPDFNTLDTCPKNGAIVCGPDGTSFYLCNFGRAVPMGSVAAGTSCKNGKIVTIGASVAPTAEPEVEPTKPSYFPVPTYTTSAELVMTTPAEVTPAPIPEPEKDGLTTTITSTEEVTNKSTSTILVTLTGKPPSATSEVPAPEVTSNPSTEGIVITKEIILQVGPAAKSCPRATNSDRAPEECATAEYAAPFITKAFKDYGINTIGEAAAILSLMQYESGDFQFNTNQFGINGVSGRPGQGTRNQMLVNFIIQYAQESTSTDSIKPGLTAENIDGESDEVKNKVLALVLGDDKTWASGAWFYKTHTPCADVMPGLQKTPVSVAAWELYITQCIGTTVADRADKFKLAVKALGGTLAA